MRRISIGIAAVFTLSSASALAGGTPPPWIGEVTAARVVADVSPDSSLGVLVSVIDSAAKSLHIAVYEFDNPAIAAALEKALDRGVEVVLALEGSPIPRLPEPELEIARTLAAKGARIVFYDRAADSEAGRRTYKFVHSKYTVADGARVVVGSANYGVNGHPVDSTFGNREANIVLDDPAAAELFEAAFEHDLSLKGEWAAYGSSPRYQAGNGDHVSRPSAPHKTYQPRFTPFEATGVPVKTVFSPDNTGPNGPVLNVLRGASSTVDIEQLNFETYWGGKTYNPTPEDSPMMKSLLELARAGRRVRVLLNDERVFRGEDLAGDLRGLIFSLNLFDADIADEAEDFLYYDGLAGRPRDNSATLEYLNRIAGRENLAIEARLLDYKNCGLNVLHNKQMIVDGEISFVGSLNWGESAMKLNREAGVLIKDAGVGRYYSSAFESDWACSSGG